MATSADNFNRGDNAVLGTMSDAANSWDEVEPAGAVSIDTNRFQSVGPGMNGAYVHDHTCYNLEAQFEWSTTPTAWSQCHYHIFARSDDNTDFDDCYRFDWEEENNPDGQINECYIYKIVGGAKTYLDGDGTDRDWDTMKAVLNGTTLQAWLGAVKVCEDIGDTTYADAGYVGMGIRTTTDAKYGWLDDWEHTCYDAPGGLSIPVAMRHYRTLRES